MIRLLCFVLAVWASPFKSKIRLAAENAALRHQLIVLRRKLRGRVQLANSDRWLFPVDWPEPFGLVMIEAMACGTPVIAFRRGSVPEIVAEGISGFVVEKIEEAVTAVGRAIHLDRAKVRAEFDRRFTAERMARNYVNVYRKLISKRSRSVHLDIINERREEWYEVAIAGGPLA